MDKGSFSMQGSIDFDAEVAQVGLSDRLKTFKSGNFDPQAYFHSNSGGMSEKVNPFPAQFRSNLGEIRIDSRFRCVIPESR